MGCRTRAVTGGSGANGLTNSHLVIGYWSENRSTFVYRLMGSHLVTGY